MGILDKIGLGKTTIKRLNKGLLDSYQNRCKGGNEVSCPWQCKMYGKNWCGISPLINFKCPNRVNCEEN